MVKDPERVGVKKQREELPDTKEHISLHLSVQYLQDEILLQSGVFISRYMRFLKNADKI